MKTNGGKRKMKYEFDTWEEFHEAMEHLEDYHDCDKCHNKIVCIGMDKLGNQTCGYCGQIVKYPKMINKKLGGGEMKTPFDTTDLEKEIEELVKMLEEEEGSLWASENETYMLEQERRLEDLNLVLKERQRLKAEVEKIIDEVDKETLENGKDVIFELKKRLENEN